MPTPGTTVNVTASQAPNVPATSLGTFFAIGQSESGPVGTPVSVTSLSAYAAVYGLRTFNGATPQLYDSLDAFFKEGGQVAVISRVSGASSASASLTLHDRAGTPLNTLTVTAVGPGTYGNAITVQVANGVPANSYVLTIVNGTTTEVSATLYSPSDAVNWAASYSQLVTITNLGSATAAPNNNPAVLAATNLAGGLDDTSPADSVWVAALTAFSSDLGPGQVAAPGRITPVVWEGLVNHAYSNNRVALLDGENVASASTIAPDAAGVQAATTDPSFGIMLAPWVTYPGVATGTATPAYPRTIAPSGPVAGAMARLAATGANGDVAAAGPNGILSSALGVTQTYDATDRSTLDGAGVGVIRLYSGNIQLYGYTSLSLDPNWTDLGNVRLRMQIVETCRNIGDSYMFADIDGAGHTASAFGGQIASFLDTLYNQNALYGLTAADAFNVNVGSGVNTPTTAAARELIAQVAVRMSQTAEQVIIDITRYPDSQSIPV